MTNIERSDELASLLFRMECGVGLPDLIYECMRLDRYDTEMFAPAVFAVGAYFASLRQTLKEMKGRTLTARNGPAETAPAPVRPCQNEAEDFSARKPPLVHF